jgi:hypothetical protein
MALIDTAAMIAERLGEYVGGRDEADRKEH